jgi:hypothetical protein
MRMRRFLGSALLAVVVAVAFAATASANDSDPKASDVADPQTTNIPYVAWAGSQIRLKKCLTGREIYNFTGIDGEGQRLAGLKLRGQFGIEAFTGGPQEQWPWFDNAPVNDVVPVWEQYLGPALGWKATAQGDTYQRYIGAEAERLCFSINAMSSFPGLAVIKLTIRKDLLGLTPGAQPDLKHQFLAIWMTARSLTLTEHDAPGVGDPGASNIFNPGQFDSDPLKEWGVGIAKAQIEGEFPHGALGPLFPSIAGTVVLPRDWGVLAGKWATDDDANTGGVYGSAPYRWDIHDDQTTASAYAPSDTFCGPGVAAQDAVDNCKGNAPFFVANDADLGPFGRFSVNHSFPGLTTAAYPAIGPFDPLRPNTSFLSNGGLPNADDAPMPAFRVDVALAGVGSLVKVDKSNLFSRNATGATTGGTAKNLYAPFYKSYLYPANGEGRSGVDIAPGNNYAGIIWPRSWDPYDFWSFDPQTIKKQAGGYNDCYDPLHRLYPKPAGNNAVTVYTDEHGQAYVGYDPVDTGLDEGLGAFILPVDYAGTPNRSCWSAFVPGEAGRGVISATGKYPEQPGPLVNADKSLTKIVNHLGSKTLVCVNKPGGSLVDGVVCTETILDLAGNPIAGAPVRFNYSGAVNASVWNGEGSATTPGPNGSLNTYTDGNGQASVLLYDSFNSCFDVIVDNLGTRYAGAEVENGRGVWRSVKVTGETGAPCAGSGLPSTTPPPAPTPPAATPPAAQQGGSGSSSAPVTTVSLGVPLQPALQVTTNNPSAIVVGTKASKLYSVKVLQTKVGRFLVVNVKGSAKKATVRIVLVNKYNQAIKTIVRTVPTNKAYKIAGFKLPKTAVSVRTSVTA